MRSSKAKQYCSVAVSKNIQKQVRKVDQIEEKICFLTFPADFEIPIIFSDLNHNVLIF